MEQFTLENDIKVLCVTAQSFPNGVMEAHEKLHSLIPFSDERRYFGISRPNQKGEIIYKAAAEEIGEAEKFDCESFIITKGKYISIFIEDYMKDIQSIGQSFQKLIAQPNIDPNGYCIEWYVKGKDVRCMVKVIN